MPPGISAQRIRMTHVGKYLGELIESLVGLEECVSHSVFRLFIATGHTLCKMQPLQVVRTGFSNDDISPLTAAKIHVKYVSPASGGIQKRTYIQPRARSGSGRGCADRPPAFDAAALADYPRFV